MYNAGIPFGALISAFIVGAGFENLVAMEGESDDFKLGVFHIEIYCVLHIESYFANVEFAVARHMITLRICRFQRSRILPERRIEVNFP